MPRVKPLGSEVMKAGALAREAGRKAVIMPNDMRKRICALQDLCGFRRREELAAALGIAFDRLTYIMRRPDTCKLNEAVSIQRLADHYGITVFEELKGAAECG